MAQKYKKKKAPFLRFVMIVIIIMFLIMIASTIAGMIAPVM